jgi:hypothetical protein
MARANVDNKLVKAITYTDTTAITVGYLPANAVISSIKVLVGTAFNAGGNDYIDIGNASVANQYADNVDVSSAGSATVTLQNVGAVISATLPTEIKAVYVPAGTSPSAGSGYVVVEYAQL